MKSIFHYSKCFVVLTLLFYPLINPSPTIAQSKSCRTPTDNQFPAGSDFNTEPATVDCSLEPICDPNNPINPNPKIKEAATDWLDHAQVICAPHPDQVFKNYGPEEWWWLLRNKDIDQHGGGSNEFINNYAMAPHLFTSDMQNVSTRYRRLSNYKDSFDTAAFNAQCLYMGFQNLDDCFTALNEMLPVPGSGNFTNLMAVGSTLERMLSTHEILNMYHQTCQNVIIPCAEGRAKSSTVCSHVYWIDAQTNVYDLCKNLPQTDPEGIKEFYNMSPQDKIKYSSITLVSTLRQAYLVFAANVKLKYTGKCTYADGTIIEHRNNCPTVVEFYIPGIWGALNAGSAQELRINLMPDVSEKALEDIHANFYQKFSPGGNACGLIKEPIYDESKKFQCIADKVNQFAPCQDCESVLQKDAQFHGAAHEPVGNQSLSLAALIAGIISKIWDEVNLHGHEVELRTAWFVVPSDMDELDYHRSADANAPIYIFQNWDENAATTPQDDQRQAVPLYLSMNGSGQHEENRTVGPTPTPIIVGTSGGESLGEIVPVAGAEQTVNEIRRDAVKFWFPTPCPECERIEQACYHPDLIAKTQGSAGGSALSSISNAVKGSNYYSACPENTDPLLAPYLAGGLIPQPTGPVTGGSVKQHLFENTCGGVCYNYILGRTRSETSCNGKVLNPYVAIAIALNENGGLVSCQPGAQEPNHFGCDLQGLAGYGQTIQEKTSCMLNTLTNACLAGKTDIQILNQYGYSSLSSLSPLAVLGYSGNELFVTSTQASSYASAIASLLPTQRNLWWAYYCPGYIAPYASSTCNQTVNCSAPPPP